MEYWNLQIILKSDFCTAAGENTPGFINIKTALEYGIPYIPAKRIKGCLLEAGREMADNGVIDSRLLLRLFGSPGKAGGEGIDIGNGYLHAVPEYLFGQDKEGTITVKDYDRFQRIVRECEDIGESLLEDIFTRRRMRTALEEETGAAKKHSLRTVQTVPAGVVFSSRIEGKLGTDEEKTLFLCARGLRHMGIGITRGLGEIRCTLEKVHEEESHGEGENPLSLKAFLPDEEVSLSYEISLKLPVVLNNGPEETIDCIPASAVAGALASMYIKKYSLGDTAHQDEDFFRIFLRDGVEFGNSFLKKGDMEYVPCPKAFALLKEDGAVWINIMRDNTNARRKGIHKQIFIRKDKLYMAEAEKEIHFHHARPADRGIGHALNDRAEDTTFPTGQFFQYIALSKGQTFAGTWKGKVKDIKKLAECLRDHDFHLKLGTSKTAEYGSCTIRLLNVLPARQKEADSRKSREWLVWLLSPLVYRNQENGAFDTRNPLVYNNQENESSDTMLHPLARQMKERLGCSIKIKATVCSYTVFTGYNSKWKLPAVPCPALAAGSGFYIEADRELEAWEIEGIRWGMLTGKGCGQVKAEPWKELIKGKAFNGDFMEAKRSMEQMHSMEETHSVGVTHSGSEGYSIEKGCTLTKDALAEEIFKYKETLVECQAVIREALEKLDARKNTLVPSSAISLLLQLLKGQKENPELYGLIKAETERISGEEKRERVLRFIKPCEGKSYEFIKQYLEAAKWMARNREVKDE